MVCGIFGEFANEWHVFFAIFLDRMTYKKKGFAAAIHGKKC